MPESSTSSGTRHPDHFAHFAHFKPVCALQTVSWVEIDASERPELSKKALDGSAPPRRRMPFICCSPPTLRHVIRSPYPHPGEHNARRSFPCVERLQNVNIQSRRRLASITGIALIGPFALSGCASDDNSSAAPKASGATTSAVDCAKGTLNGEGSSAQKNAIEEAIRAFQEKCAGATVNYAATGSGAGIKQFIAGQVDFGGSDSALKTVEKDGKIEADEAAKACGSPAWNLPMVTGPVAFAYNLKGVDKLIITPDVAAKIFNGVITKWNDPAIAAINPGVTLPDKAIKVFFRSDESGTTDNFTKWLNGAAPKAWPAEPGKKWTGKGEGKPQNTGVATAVKDTDGGVTYTEWSFAKDNKLGIAQIDNGGGPVELNAETVGKSVATAKQVGTGNDLALKLNYATKEAGAYPIVLVAYEIVCSKAKTPAKVALLKGFMNHFANTDTQKSLEDIGYAPLPSEIQAKVTTAINALS
jgi:phosphate transport system substrate-binding protein